MGLLQEALVHWVEQPARKESIVQLLPGRQLKGRTGVKSPRLPAIQIHHTESVLHSSCQYSRKIFSQVAQHGGREEAYFSANSHVLATGKGPFLGYLLRPDLLVLSDGLVAQPWGLAWADPEQRRAPGPPLPGKIA